MNEPGGGPRPRGSKRGPHGGIRSAAAILTAMVAAAIVIASATGRAQPMPRGSGSAAMTGSAPTRLSSASATHATRPPSDTGPTSPAASASAAEPATPPTISPRERALRETTRRIRALLRAELAVSIDPATLFVVDLTDEESVQLEARRLRALLAGAPLVPVEPASGPAASTSATGAPSTTRPAPPAVASQRAPAAASAVASASAGASPLDVAPGYPALPRELWDARLELDAARLAFLELPRAERAALLDGHRKRQTAAEEADRSATKRLSETEIAARTAASAQQRALEDARRARSEAKRVVSEERARLLGISAEQARFEADLIRGGQRFDERADLALKWQRRVRELLDQRAAGAATAAQAEAMYDELRTALRALRTELTTSLGQVTTASAVPAPGPNPLADLPSDVDLGEATRLRAEVQAKANALGERERAERWSSATQLYRFVESLNELRVQLYPALGSSRRAELTGFGLPGWDQARAEGQQLSLVARYHVLAAGNWIASASRAGLARAEVVFAVVDLLKALGVLLAGSWALRRLEPLLSGWRGALDASVVGGSAGRRFLHRLLGVSVRIRSPLGWLVTLQVAVGLLTTPVQGLLEVRLLLTVVSWVLGASLVVNLVDALSGSRVYGDVEPTVVDRLRLRTLRLLGRVVVSVGLTLSLTALLVGEGTIYGWVLTTCWLLTLPVVVVLLRWWREIIFERLSDRRHTGAVPQWVVSRRRTWTDALAVAVGAGYLLARGVARGARRYLGGFVLTRRLLAFLFRRELTKQSRIQHLAQSLMSPPPEVASTFDPESPPVALLTTAADADVERVLDVIRAPRGGVFAVVGERGSGKTTLLERIVGRHPESRSLQCPLGGWPRLLRELADRFELPPDADEDAVARAVSASGAELAILVDNAHRLARPTVGGLVELDRLFSLARRTSDTCAWVLTFDRALWPFVRRSRGSLPLFDRVIELAPWSEEQIAELIEHRCTQGGVAASFEGLVATPADDEFQRGEQLRRTRAGFYRLLWDYSRGNPAVALQFWAQSLGMDPDGRAHVKLFTPPALADLEELPDEAAFVLSALVQLEPARREEVLAATRLPARSVDDVLRYARVRGQVELVGSRYRVAWAWYRATTQLLERRHLREA